MTPLYEIKFSPQNVCTLYWTYDIAQLASANEKISPTELTELIRYVGYDIINESIDTLVIAIQWESL